MELKDKIRAARIKAGFKTQTALANACGVDPSAINHVENGRTKGMSGNLLAKLCKALDVPPEWFKSSEAPSITQPAAGLKPTAHLRDEFHARSAQPHPVDTDSIEYLAMLSPTRARQIRIQIMTAISEEEAKRHDGGTEFQTPPKQKAIG